MKFISIAALTFTLASPLFADSYYSLYQSTATGTATQNLSGTLCVAASSTTPTSCVASLNSSNRMVDIVASALANSKNQIRIKGYQSAFESLNAAGTQNWYFGSADQDPTFASPLYIGKGYSAGQGIAPNIVIIPGGNVGIGGGVALSSEVFNGYTNVYSVFNVTSKNADQLAQFVRLSNSASSGGGFVSIEHYSGSFAPQPTLDFFASRGTLISSSAVQGNDVLAVIGPFGYDGSVWYESADAISRASQNWTSTAHGSQWQFYTTANNSSVQSLRMTIDQAGNVGLPNTIAQSRLFVSGGSLSVNGGDGDFTQGGQRAFIDIGPNLARIGAISGGGANMDTAIYVGVGTSAAEKARLTSGGNFGVGTSFPQTTAQFVGVVSSSQAVVGQTGISAGNLFQVGNSTFSVTSSGHVTTQGALPTTSSCNSQNVNANSNDMRGSVTFAGGAQSACTINFINAGGLTTPFCTCSDASASTAVRCNPGSGTLTMTLPGAANDTLTYHCDW